ncbi:MAG: tetratricopeptide repeat protein, partial [Ignavibacteriaceae bacterium]
AYSDELKIYKDEKIYGRDYIVWALVKNGKIQQAEELLNKMQAEASDFNTRFRFAVKYSSSLVLFEEKKYGKAVRQFEDAFTALPPKHEPNFFYAVSLLKSGETVKAVSEFQKIKDWPFKFQFAEGPGAMAYWPIQNVKSHYWLGAAYEKTGNREEAIKEYEHFMEIWKDYDFNSPEIRDAKIRIAKLKGVAFR